MAFSGMLPTNSVKVKDSEAWSAYSILACPLEGIP